MNSREAVESAIKRVLNELKAEGLTDDEIVAELDAEFGRKTSLTSPVQGGIRNLHGLTACSSPNLAGVFPPSAPAASFCNPSCNPMEMTMADTDHILTMTLPAEIAFAPALFEKRQVGGKGEGRWELALLMEPNHPDLQHAKQICKTVAERQSPGITASPTAWKYPWQPADAYIASAQARGKTYDNSHMAGKVLLNTHATKYEPKLSVLMAGRGVVDFWDEAARQTIKDKFYAGCQALCEIAFVWYPAGNGLPGVTAYLNKVCSLNKGERRASGGRSGQETWGAHVGHLSSVDPLAAVEY